MLNKAWVNGLGVWGPLVFLVGYAIAVVALLPAVLFTLEEVMASPTVFDPMTRLQCCPPTCGAAAAVLCSEAFARRRECLMASPPDRPLRRRRAR